MQKNELSGYQLNAGAQGCQRGKFCHRQGGLIDARLHSLVGDCRAAWAAARTPTKAELEAMCKSRKAGQVVKICKCANSLEAILLALIG